jgi:hypothetical protein
MGLANYRLTPVKDKKSGLPKMKAEFTQRKDTLDVGSDGQIIDRWVLSGVDPIVSSYNPTPQDQQVLAQARKMYADADVVMRTPRREFNDLSVFTRMQVDQMAFNTYQPNNGDPPLGDNTESWKSNAMTPVVRNKCISIAAHICARTIFPKVFAWNEQSEAQEDAAMVMRDLYQWFGEQINYPFFSLKLILTALWSPVAIGELGYHETQRTAFVPDGNGGITEETDEDEDLSGFMGSIIGADELYISNFYENDIQKQSYLIKRTAKFYDIAKEEYAYNPNFQYVRPGMITLFDDANQMFYEVYDSNMRKDMVEEVTVYRRNKNTVWKIVNGVLMTPWNNPNPRQDKRYPFFKTGFEFMDEGQCFYYKSLAFKTQQDANIINTLYPMIVDGTYLSIMPPLLNTTGENIPSSVIIPGASISTSQPNNGKIDPLRVAGIKDGLEVIQTVQESLDDSAPQLELGSHRITAYEMAIKEQEQAILLGLFTAMIGDMVKQMGRLMVSDILQYLTIGEATGITGDSKLIYKTFIVQQKGSGKQKHHRIVFDSGLPNENISDEDLLKLSLETLKMQGGLKSTTKLSRVNPSLFRELKYAIVASPDVLNPLSEETERAFKLQIYDQAIQNPRIQQDPEAMDAVTRDFLFGAFPESSHNPDKYMPKKATPGQPMPQMQPQMGKSPQPTPNGMATPTPQPNKIPAGMPMGIK